MHKGSMYDIQKGINAYKQLLDNITYELECTGVILESIQADIKQLDESELDNRIEDAKYYIEFLINNIKREAL